MQSVQLVLHESEMYLVAASISLSVVVHFQMRRNWQAGQIVFLLYWLGEKKITNEVVELRIENSRNVRFSDNRTKQY